MSFRGVSQTLPSYVRRFCRRLVQHHLRLLDGTTKIPASVYQKALVEANRSSKISRLTNIGNNPGSYSSQMSEQHVASQGSFFLKCTCAGILITQGDILPKEGNKLMKEIRHIFRAYAKAENHFETNPVLRDLLYRPHWRPRDSSPCLLPGVALVSDGEYRLNWAVYIFHCQRVAQHNRPTIHFTPSMRKSSSLSPYCSIDCLFSLYVSFDNMLSWYSSGI